jgi:hypothetical protein
MTLRRYSPDGLRAEFDVRDSLIPRDALFNKNKYKRHLEMYPAHRFASGYQQHVASCTILWEDVDTQSDQDFFLEVGGIRHRIQLAEVGPPGRTRGLEYRPGGPPGPFEDKDYEAGGRLGPVWIRQVIEKKAAKNYSTSNQLHLLLYVNFAGWDLSHKAIQDEAGPLVQSFASVWLVTGNMVCGLHKASDLGTLLGWGQISG